MNQDQRELLELAAYAIGYKIGCRGCGIWGCVGECEWNPLTNKANAFDLMVKLGMSVIVTNEMGVSDVRTETKWLSEDHWNGAEAATMLAITRAAAEIGKQMKGNGE